MKTKETHTKTLVTSESGASPAGDIESRGAETPWRISVWCKDRTPLPLLPSEVLGGRLTVSEETGRGKSRERQVSV